MSRMLFVLSAVVLAATPVAAQTPARPGGDAVLQRTAEDLAALWQGAYDTANQVNFQERFNLSEGGWVTRQHKIFARVAVPAFGPYVTYVEQYQGTPPDQLFRQRLYVHRIDDLLGQVVTDIYSFSDEDAAAVVGAQDDPSKLAAFTPGRLSKIPDGCAIRWQKLGETFLGTQTPDDCLYTPAGFGQQVRLRDTITLTADAMTTQTEILDANGAVLMANDLGTPEVARKARPFTCMMLALNPAMEHRFERYADIKTHDQGGEFTVVTQHDPPKELHVRLLKIVPPAGTSRDTLIMTLREKNGLFPLTNAFVAPDAPRVAISIAGVEANCTADDADPARF